jgi:hypothetical protein
MSENETALLRGHSGADERKIRQLTAERDELKRINDALGVGKTGWPNVIQAERERDRYRAALEKICSLYAVWDADWFNKQSPILDIGEIAKQALEGGDGK